MISTAIFKLDSWHPYTQRILNNALNYGTTFPNRSSIVIIDNIVRDFVACGFWQLLDIFYLFGGNPDVTQNFRAINWINPSKFYGAFLGSMVEGSLNQYGLKGNGTAGVNGISFNTNYAYNVDNVKYNSMNNASLGCITYVDDTNPVDDSDAYVSSRQSGRYPRISPGTQRIGTANSGISIPLGGVGFKVLNRTSATIVNGIYKTDLTTRASNSVAELAQPAFIQALRMTDVNSSYVSNAGLTMIFVGASIPYAIAQQIRDIMNNRFYIPLGLTPLA